VVTAKEARDFLGGGWRKVSEDRGKMSFKKMGVFKKKGGVIVGLGVKVRGK